MAPKACTVMYLVALVFLGTLLASKVAGAVPNDECTSATQLMSNGENDYITPYTLENATTSPGGCLGIQSDVWFRTADITQGSSVIICNCGMAMGDTIISVYSACDGTLLGCNTLGCTDGSIVTFEAPATSTYLARIGQPTMATPSMFATGMLSVLVTPNRPPANDECSGAISVSSGGMSDYMFPYTCQNATDSPDGCDGIHSDVWFRTDIIMEGMLVVVCNCGMSTGDSVIAVYSDCGLTLLGCNADGCNGNESIVTFMAPHTGYYWVRVGQLFLSNSSAWSSRMVSVIITMPLATASASQGSWSTTGSLVLVPPVGNTGNGMLQGDQSNVSPSGSLSGGPEAGVIIGSVIGGLALFSAIALAVVYNKRHVLFKGTSAETSLPATTNSPPASSVA